MTGERGVIMDKFCISEERLSGSLNYIKMSMNCFEEPYDNVEHSVQRGGRHKCEKIYSTRKEISGDTQIIAVF